MDPGSHHFIVVCLRRRYGVLLEMVVQDDGTTGNCHHVNFHHSTHSLYAHYFVRIFRPYYRFFRFWSRTAAITSLFPGQKVTITSPLPQGQTTGSWTATVNGVVHSGTYRPEGKKTTATCTSCATFVSKSEKPATNKTAAAPCPTIDTAAITSSYRIEIAELKAEIASLRATNDSLQLKLENVATVAQTAGGYSVGLLNPQSVPAKKLTLWVGASIGTFSVTAHGENQTYSTGGYVISDDSAIPTVRRYSVTGGTMLPIIKGVRALGTASFGIIRTSGDAVIDGDAYVDGQSFGGTTWSLGLAGQVDLFQAGPARFYGTAGLLR
jgi:hypothetical protein